MAPHVPVEARIGNDEGPARRPSPSFFHGSIVTPPGIARMAALFGVKQQAQPSKIVPHGGLGGLVAPDIDVKQQSNIKMEFKRVQKLRCRPPPLRISSGCDQATSSSAQFSAVSSLGIGGLWTPKTPTDQQKHSLFGGEKKVGYSPLTAAPVCILASPPQTPISLERASLAELPGSLLLASQGFPQTFPLSPPAPLRLLRRDTEESTSSSAPSLCTSVSTDEGAMDAFRPLAPRKHDRSRSDMPTSYTIGSRVPAISKPFVAMNVKDLLDTLPNCDSATILHHWLPAMRVQVDKMIQRNNSEARKEIESSTRTVALHQEVLRNFSSSLERVSAKYTQAVDAAEELAKRGSTGAATNDRLAHLEGQVEDAALMLQGKDSEIEDRARVIEEKQYTIHEVTRLLGTFIQANIPSWIDKMNEPDTQQVMRIIADYTSTHDQNAVEHVRVPEGTLNKHVKDLRESRNLNGEYRKVLDGQTTLIKDQSRKFDIQVDKYEQAIKLIKEKDHEIVYLVQQQDALTKQLEDLQPALAEGQARAEAADKSDRRYDELRGNMESLKTAHELELDQKDVEIANLRQKLGSAREEVFARREDVKNVVAHNQAMLQARPDPQHAAPKNTSTSKALRFFGMEKDKYKKGNVPGSQSTLGLSSIDLRYSSKEVAPAVGKEILRHRPSLQTHSNPRSALSAPHTPVEATRGPFSPWTAQETRPHPDSAGLLPPRRDSFGAAQQYGSVPVSPMSPASRDKPLPSAPLDMSQMTAARLMAVTSAVDSPLQAQITSDYLNHGIMGQTSQSARRVLSRITEASVSRSGLDEDEFRARLDGVDEDDDDQSVASSDREVYRKSITALDMLNSGSGLPYSETETDMERIIRGAGISPDTGSSPQRSAHLPPGFTYDNSQDIDAQSQTEEDYQTCVARVLQLRPGTRNLRRSGGTHDGIIEADNHHGMSSQYGVIGQERARRQYYPRDRDSSGESYHIQHERPARPARESIVSNSSSAGYRSEDLVPKTVTQMYHSGKRHIRN